ncbi:hypothetical protein, partial [Campylobacter showae]
MSVDISQFSLNGDCGTFFDGESVICTIDKREYTVAFSFMAQISKSDFGIFYCVIVPVDPAVPPVNSGHSGALSRSPLYILPSVYVMAKPVASGNGGGGGVGGGGGSGENGDDPRPIG